MEAIKPWYLSRTMWASIVTVALSAGGVFGFSTSGIDCSSLTDTLLQAISGVAGIAAVVARLLATHQLK
jgi:hypothetical protein